LRDQTHENPKPITAASDASRAPWRDLTDPRRATSLADLEEGLKEPVFENVEIPEPLGPVTIMVDDHKIKRFAFTQDDYSPWSLHDSPFGGRIGQPALLGNDLLQLFTTRYRASRTVGFHTEEQMWFDNPVKLGETVTLAGTYTEAYVLRGQGCVVMEAQAAGEDGRSIIRHRGVEILRTVPGAIAERASSTPTRKVTGEIPSGARYVDAVGEDVRVGDALSPMRKIITFEQAAIFSRLGEYVRNTHNDLAIARGGQLRVPIVQGQQQAGCMAEFLGRAFGAAWYTDGWFQLKFIATLEVFEPVTFYGLVTRVTPTPEGRKKVEFEVWARRQSDSRMTVVGWASCVTPERI
jgi:acyl dehydratase